MSRFSKKPSSSLRDIGTVAVLILRKTAYWPRSPKGILGNSSISSLFSKIGLLSIPQKSRDYTRFFWYYSRSSGIYSVNTGMLIPFSFNFTNCSCTSSSKRIRSCARGETRVTFPLPKRVAKPCLIAPKRPPDPKWLCDSCVTYSLKHVEKFLSSPIGNYHRK